MDRAIRLYVPLQKHEVERLIEVADAERRTPRDQAAVLLAAALKTTTPKNQEASLT